jgi:hypothetical protein
MTKRISIYLFATAVAAVMLAISGPASASSGASAKPLRVVPIVMADPGCHWFRVGGKNLIRLTVTGKTAFVNQDEAALIFEGKNFARRLPVGKRLVIAKAGVYHITMVDQAPDDNHLVLLVK